jgi:hypothetical protein
VIIPNKIIMTAKTIFDNDRAPKLMDNFLSNTFADLYVSGYHNLDGAEDFAAVIKATVTDTYNHAATDDNNLKKFLGFADDVIEKSTGRTVYMDSNIALTDGSKLARDGARVIPNLYEAIDGLRLGEEILAKQTGDLISKIETIGETHGPSTADAGLYVNYISAGSPYSEAYTAFMTTDKFDNYVISPGTGTGGYNRDANATNSTNANLHFSANEITFTVANHNNLVSNVYLISGALTTADFELNAGQLTAQGSVLNNLTGTIYYWVPLEDYTIEGNTIPAGSHGKIFAKNTTTNAPQTLQNRVVVCYSHAVTLGDVGDITAQEGGLNVGGTMTYNLGAIIEAIQELNRRTMFMDIDMSFNGAMSYGDYVSDIVTAGAYGKVLDGLPGATDADHGKHYA